MRLFWDFYQRWSERLRGQEALGIFKIHGRKSWWVLAAAGLMLVVGCQDEFNFDRKLLDVSASTQELQELQELNKEPLMGGQALLCQQTFEAPSADKNSVAVKVRGDTGNIGDAPCFTLMLSHQSNLASSNGGNEFDVVPILSQEGQIYQIQVSWHEDPENSSAVTYEYQLRQSSATSDGQWLPLAGRGKQVLPTPVAVSDSVALKIRKVEKAEEGSEKDLITGQAGILLSYNQAEKTFEILHQNAVSEEMLSRSASNSAEPFPFFAQSGPSRITVSWDSVDSQSSVVDLEYRINNDIEWHSMGLESPFVIDGLKPSQLYELWLRVVYDDGFSEAGLIKLTTLAEEFIGDADVGSAEAEALVFSLLPKEMSMIVNWKAPRWFDVSKIQNYQYRIVDGDSQWNDMGVSGFHEIKELQPGATYVIEFRVIYTDGPGDSVKTSVKTQGVSERESDP